MSGTPNLNATNANRSTWVHSIALFGGKSLAGSESAFAVLIEPVVVASFNGSLANCKRF